MLIAIAIHDLIAMHTGQSIGTMSSLMGLCRERLVVSMVPSMTKAERVQVLWLNTSLFALFYVPIGVAGFFSPHPSLPDRIAGVGIVVLCLACVGFYQRKYGFRFRPEWKWQLTHWGKPDYAYAEGLPWFVRITGWLSIALGLYFCSAPIVLYASSTASHVPQLLCFIWLGVLLIAGGIYFTTSRSGVYVYRESRLVTAWSGLGCPMLRKDFGFDEFTDTSIHFIVPKGWPIRSHWRVWLRERTSAIWIRARDIDDARRIATQLAETVGVRYCPRPEEATRPD